MESTFNSLSDLAQELDYQKEYTYEQRIDIFNKYHISTSTKYINPLMLLTAHIRKNGSNYSEFESHRYHGVSHSGAVQTAFNKEIKENTSKYVTIRNMQRFNIYEVFNYNYSTREMMKVMLFKEMKEDNLVSFKLINADDFFPKRGFCFYESAEEFCKDFGFNVNFK